MEIVQERLEREFDMDLITTAPTVIYEVVLRDGSILMVDNPSKMPDPSKIEEIREPIVTVNLYMPQEYSRGGVIASIAKTFSYFHFPFLFNYQTYHERHEKL